MTPIVKTSGALSTNGSVTTAGGVLTYAEATAGTLTLYDGSTSGNLLLTVTSSGNVPLSVPVQFGDDGLYATVSSTSVVGVVHHT